MPFVSINPATATTFAEYEANSAEQIESALANATTAFSSWRHSSFDDRAQLMVRAAELLEGEIPVVAELMTSEMGKTFAAAKGEAAKCAMAMRYYAEHAQEFLATEPVATSASRSGVRYDPLGAILAVMPWNFPLWQVVRFAAPTLMAGNVGLLKHAANVPGTAQYLEGLFRRAGFPNGTFTNMFVTHDQTSQLIGDPRVAAVTLTGSEGAGRAVAATAGQHLKKCVMELGGSDAFIVANSADLDHTVPLAVTARVQNNGQSCIASKRFIVVASRASEFVERFAAAMAAVPVGDPMDPSTVVGPLANLAQRDLLVDQVAHSVSHGAKVLAGGSSIEGPGYFFQPTVLSDVALNTRAGAEELFGPVAVVQVVRDLDEAIGVANASPWGLGASIWAQDRTEIDAAIAGVEAGMVFANAVVASTPELPFGGIKNSGFGRELSAHGIREFVNIKAFFVA